MQRINHFGMPGMPLYGLRDASSDASSPTKASFREGVFVGVVSTLFVLTMYGIFTGPRIRFR